MKRTLITALISTSLLVAPGCKDKAADEAKAGESKDGAKDGDAKDGEAKDAKAEEKADEKKAAAPAAAPGGGSDPMPSLALVPEGAFMAMSFDVGGMQAIPVMGMDLIEQSIKDPEDKETYAAMKECGLTLNLMRRISVGGSADDDGGMAILDGKGIAEKSKAECMAKWLEEKKGRKTTFSDGDGFTKMVEDKDDSVVYLAGADRIIFTDDKYAPKVEEMLTGKGGKAIDGSLKAAIGMADKGATMFGVMTMTDEQRGQVGPDAGPFKELTGAAFALAPNGDGVAFNVKVGMPDGAKAEAAKGFMSRKYEEVKPMAAMFGIPPNVAAALTFGVDGNAATASLPLSKADLENLKAIAEAQAAQMAGGMPPGGMPPGGMPPGGMPPGGMPPGGMPGGM